MTSIRLSIESPNTLADVEEWLTLARDIGFHDGCRLRVSLVPVAALSVIREQPATSAEDPAPDATP